MKFPIFSWQLIRESFFPRVARRFITIWIIPISISLSVLFFPPLSYKIQRKVMQYSDGQYYCYKLLDSKDQTNQKVGGSFALSPKLLNEYMKVPLSFISYKWCTQNKSSLSLSPYGAADILKDFSVKINGNAQLQYQFTCPEPSSIFSDGCQPISIEEVQKMGSGEIINFAFSYELQNICPTDYLSKLERTGWEKPGRMIISFKLKLRDPLLVSIIVFFVTSSIWWGWLALLKNLYKKVD